MNVSRRTFLNTIGTGTAAAAVLQFPLVGRADVARKNGSSVILNSNENAYGPSSRVLKAMRDALAKANRYPDSSQEEFREHVAKKHGVSANQVAIGCGSSEILTVAVHAFTSPQKKLVVPSPTFESPARRAEGIGSQVVKVPLAKDYSHDLSRMLEGAGSDAGLVYICNPNNPTGSLTPRRELEAFIAKLPAQTYVLVDEAYHDFALGAPDYQSFLDRSVDNERVIVARTFSKAFGLAGMRLGYGIGSRKAIERMQVLINTFNANISALRGALEALQDEEGLRASVTRNAADRTEFIRQANSRKLSPIPSFTNFAMMDIGRPVKPVIEYFQKRNILVGRPFPPFDNHLRISFGLPAEMKEFWRAWDQLPRLTG